MFTKTVFVAALAGLAAAAPTKRTNNNSFTAITIHSTSPIQNSGISASNQRFFVGNSTKTYCPAETIDCSQAGTQTSFTYIPDSQSLAMNVAVPGGQRVYVAADGALGFTGAHTSSTPDGSISGPFEYIFVPEGSVGQLTFQSLGFDACPTGDVSETCYDIYQIFARAVETTKTDCIDVTIGTSLFDGAEAWQYE